MVYNKDTPKNHKPNGNVTRGGKNRTKPTGGRANASGSTQPWHGYVEEEESSGLSKSIYASDTNRSGIHNQPEGRRRRPKIDQNAKAAHPSNSAASRDTKSMPQNNSTTLDLASSTFNGTSMHQFDTPKYDSFPPASRPNLASQQSSIDPALPGRSQAQQLSQALVKEKISQLETQIQSLNSDVAQSQIDLIAARDTEQTAIHREKVTRAELEELSSQVTAAQLKAKSQDSINFALAAENSALKAETKALREHLSNSRKELSRAQLTELNAKMSETVSQTQLQHAESEIQKLQEELDLASSKPPEPTTSTNAKSTVQNINQPDSKTSHDQISQLEKRLHGAQENTTKLQSEVERLSRQISLAASQEAASRLAEYKAVERAANARSEVQSLRGEVDALRESVSRTQRGQIDEADELRVSLNGKSTAMTASSLKSDRVPVLDLRGNVVEPEVKLDKKTACTCGRVSADESAPIDGKHKQSLNSLRGQLILAKTFIKSAQLEKSWSITENTRLRGEVARFKEFERDVAKTVGNGRKDFDTLQTELYETKKQLRKSTGDMRKPKEPTADADKSVSQTKTKTTHLHIQTTQLATLREKDVEIEKLRLRAGRVRSDLTSMIIAKNDEIKNLRTTLRLANDTSRASINRGTPLTTQPGRPRNANSTTCTDIPPAPYFHHKMSKEAQDSLDTEIAQSRQAFEGTRRRRSNAFRQFQLEQENLPHRDQGWRALEEDTYQEQQSIRLNFLVKKEALIRKTRLAEDWLSSGLAKQREVEARQSDRKESLAEARKGKQKIQETMEEFDDL